MISWMADYASKSLGEPDETIRLPGVELDVVDLGDLTVGRAVHEPGWRWSTHVRPIVGGEWCQVRHVGVVLSGRMGILLSDGTSLEFQTDDVLDIPPGHDGYVIGHEPCVLLEWGGIRAFAGFTGGLQNRVLATLLVLEPTGADARAREMGDAAWRDFLSGYFESVRLRLQHFRGTEISLSESRIVATFQGPAQALRCAVEIRRLASNGLRVRGGVHVGEVELVGNDVRGIAVREAERMAELATEDEILVSETTRALAAASGFRFEDRGASDLEDIPGGRMYAFVVDDPASAS